MKELEALRVRGLALPVERCGILVIGSGAAALAAAERLAAFAASGGAAIASDIFVATESLSGGTSFNAGSDKQTYYRLSPAQRSGDSAHAMAEALWEGGAMHGDIALAEAIASLEAFYHLVSIGLPFPMNASGAFVGYKTDHDPRRRGTSIGPYTSKAMVERLLAETRARGIPIAEGLHAVALVADSPKSGEGGQPGRHGRIFGALFVDESSLGNEAFGLRLVVAEAVVFGVGGPGGLYSASVYPAVHSGAIGLAMEIGAACVNLTESQFGLASTGFRWNLSGSYQQAVPRYVSRGPGGDEEEFLSPFFPSPAARDTAVFLKGYQWPFDPCKVAGFGSSLVDILVHRERLLRGRRVFLDYTRNPSGWDPDALSLEARDYLERSNALGGNPIDRLRAMNPLAAEHYASHGIDLSREGLEVAVCAQHNNGGLAADSWWESTDIDGFFPVGEVNGSHGVYRQGGAALNAGQVGAIRAARRIAGARADPELRESDWLPAATAAAGKILDIISSALESAPRGASLFAYREEFRARMDRHGGIIRPASEARQAAREARAQFDRFPELSIPSRREIVDLLRCRHLALAQAAYLEAIASYAESGGGTRGSAIISGREGEALHPGLDPEWNSLGEKKELLEFLQELRFSEGGFETHWEARRPIPESEDWFENVWRDFREGRIFGERDFKWTRSG